MKLNELRDNEGAAESRALALDAASVPARAKPVAVVSRVRSPVPALRSKALKAVRCRFTAVLPKRGFTNIFAKDFNTVSVGRVQKAIDAGKLNASETVTVEALKAAGVVKRVRDGVRIVANGELTAAVTFEVAGASKGAVAAIEKAGGKVAVLGAQA